MHDDGFGLTELPGGVTGVGTHQGGDFVPERHVVPPPLLRVGEPLPFIPRHVVPDEVQWNDRHARRLNDAVRSPVVVHQHQSLPDARKRLTRQVFHRKGRGGGLLASQHCSQEPIAETTIAVVAEAQRLGHASILPALPITVRKTNAQRGSIVRPREAIRPVVTAAPQTRNSGSHR